MLRAHATGGVGTRNRHSQRYSTAAAAAGSKTPVRPLRPVQQHKPATAAHTEAQLRLELDRQAAVLQGLSKWASAELPRYLRPAEQQWQPADLLPNPASPTYPQQLAELQEEARALPGDVLVVLAGLAVVASTVPNQLSLWCGTPALQDVSGADEQPWARWRRCWAADSLRHRQLLLSYCYLSGAVSMEALHRTMQGAIGAGCDSGSQEPYQQLMHSMVQARMSRVMHGNLAKVAGYHGASRLAQMASTIATDEARHEVAVVSSVSQLFTADPQAAVRSFACVVQRGVLLPGARMDDGWHDQGNPQLSTRLHLTTSSSSSSSSSSNTSSTSASDQHLEQQQIDGQLHDPAAAAAAAAATAASRQCSQLYVSFMAAADALGVWTIADMAAAVEQCCRLWKVSDIAAAAQAAAADSISSGEGRRVAAATAATAQQLLRHPSMLQRLSELQLEGKLRARRRDRLQSACFSWLFKREVLLS